MLQLKTPPTLLAVSLENARAQCRCDSTDDDSDIERFIREATEDAEQLIGRSIMPQTWRLVLDGFGCEAILLPRIPVASVASVKYIDTAGTEVPLDSSKYSLLNFDDFAPAVLEPAYGTSWPATRSQAGAVRIEYNAGYASPAEVPHGISGWILLQVAAKFENRQSTTEVQTYALGFADRLLDRWKVWGG